MGSFRNGEFWAEIFFEGSIISFFITVLYFALFVSMEEHSILEQLKFGLTQLIEEMIIPLSFVTDEKKQEYTEIVKAQPDPVIDPKLLDDIKTNNDFYYDKALKTVGVYSGIMLLMSIIAWKISNPRNFELLKYVNHIILPGIIAAGIVIGVEVVFVKYILGNFMPLDINKTMTVILDEFKQNP